MPFHIIFETCTHLIILWGCFAIYKVSGCHLPWQLVWEGFLVFLFLSWRYRLTHMFDVYFEFVAKHRSRYGTSSKRKMGKRGNFFQRGFGGSSSTQFHLIQNLNFWLAKIFLRCSNMSYNKNSHFFSVFSSLGERL